MGLSYRPLYHPLSIYMANKHPSTHTAGVKIMTLFGKRNRIFQNLLFEFKRSYNNKMAYYKFFKIFNRNKEP